MGDMVNAFGKVVPENKRREITREDIGILKQNGIDDPLMNEAFEDQ
ncbi:hypothetical protein HON22_04405 [Candidatus Peregrinibacteria bacterium]|jgi:hypothetical protein|nr:hypothetical protein [Candidatus Peregrinibacteria bacterium]